MMGGKIAEKKLANSLTLLGFPLLIFHCGCRLLLPVQSGKVTSLLGFEPAYSLPKSFFFYGSNHWWIKHVRLCRKWLGFLVI